MVIEEHTPFNGAAKLCKRKGGECTSMTVVSMRSMDKYKSGSKLVIKWSHSKLRICHQILVMEFA